MNNRPNNNPLLEMLMAAFELADDDAFTVSYDLRTRLAVDRWVYTNDDTLSAFMRFVSGYELGLSEAQAFVNQQPNMKKTYNICGDAVIDFISTMNRTVEPKLPS